MSAVIHATGLGKKYAIGHQEKAQYETLSEKLYSFPWSFFDKRSKKVKEFWALRDISFTIEQGDRVGIIGRNGAGKSTLLKILSRITPPTEGSVKITGSVSSLLEVGTGFHPELTGRENIFLNAAILGIPRQDVKKHFDEIVDFSGVESFLDTPVKRYSSGMGARLGFAVASHLARDILIVDEVLAVGDISFQKKCIKKMQSLSKDSNRTVLFVSHNVHLLKRICNKGIYLDSGYLRCAADIDKACSEYFNANGSLEGISILKKSEHIELTRYATEQCVSSGDDWHFSFTFFSSELREGCYFDFGIYSEEIFPIIHYVWQKAEEPFTVPNGSVTIRFSIKKVELNCGAYKLGIYLADIHGNVIFEAQNIEAATVVEAPLYTGHAAVLSNEIKVELLRDQAS